VQLERKKRRIAGANKGLADNLLDGARQSGDGDGIPNLDEQRFRPVGEPVEFRIGVFDCDEGVVSFDDRAFLDGADAQREAAAVLGVERSEAFVVKSFRMAGEVRVGDAAGFFDVVEGEDLAGEVGFDDVLQHGEHGLFKHAAARFEVGIDVTRVRRILPPVGELVGVRVEDGVQAQRLHGAPRKMANQRCKNPHTADPAVRLLAYRFCRMVRDFPMFLINPGTSRSLDPATMHAAIRPRNGCVKE